MQDIFLRSITLSNFRNFESFNIEISNQPILLIGENGTGKTNLLEAISLLSPGRGLRQAKFSEMSRNQTLDWRVTFEIVSKVGIAKIFQDYNFSLNRRSLEFNGSKITSSELTKFLSIIWTIPQMKEIFASSLSERRKFFDRMVYNFDPLHAARINKYEYYLQERQKLLQESLQNDWLDMIEEKIAMLSLEIANARNIVIEKLQIELDNLDNNFPKAKIIIDINIDLSDDLITHIKDGLFKSRKMDFQSGRSNFGVHRTDFIVTHQPKGQLAKYCSTGEQKAMIISLNIAQILAYMKAYQAKPILLLDEVFIHLDNLRKQYFIDFLLSHQLQSFVTQTDLNGINSLAECAEIIRTNDL